MENKKEFTSRHWLILMIFGLVGQIAWSVENMYFNLFVFNEIDARLDVVTLMVQLSGVAATLTTLIAGTLSDKLGNRRRFISLGYAIWGVTVALFGFISPELIQQIFNTDGVRAVSIALFLVVAGDCVMTFFGSSANDAGFNAWVTDNTTPENRGGIEGVLAILPLIAMLIVAGGFGILVGAVGYKIVFLGLGIVISASGILGLFIIKDAQDLKPNGSFKDIFYGFKPSVIRGNLPLYVTLIIVMIYGIACQIFMPYLIIYMSTYLGFSDLEYSAVFAMAILFGAAINLYLTRLSDRKDKATLMYVGGGIFAVGLMGMYLARGMESKLLNIILFGVAGFVMIVGYIFVSALCGSTVRDYTPEGEVGKLQGVRMVFSVLIPMLIGPMIGNAINAAMNIPLPDQGSADAMTTKYIPAPEIFLVGAIVAVLMMAVIPLLKKVRKSNA